MKVANIFLIQAIVEIIAGLLLISNIDIFFLTEEWTNQSAGIIRVYGLAALVLGGVSLQLYKYFEYTALFKMCSLIFMTFHILLGFHLAGLFKQLTIDHIAPSAFHILFGIAFAFCYYQDSDKFK